MRKIERFEAHLDDYKTITVYLSKQFYQGKSEFFMLRNPAGKLQRIPIHGFELTSNDYNKYTLAAPENIDIGAYYEIVEEHSLSTPLQYSLICKTPRFDQEFYYEGEDLGVHPENSHTDFALWAPTANKIAVEIVSDEYNDVKELKRTEKGVFRVAHQ